MPPKIGRPHNDQVSLEECKRQINIAHDMVKSQGATYDLAKAFYLYGVYVIQEYREYKLGVETIRSGYDTIQRAIERGTKGGSWIDLDKYSWKHNRASYKELDLFYEICRYLAFYDFEPFIYYMEKNRSPEKRFYAPRRKTLGKLIKDFEDLARRKIKFLGISLPSRTGKSTLCIFFLAWLCLVRPNSHSAMGGHSGILAKGFYNELLNLISTNEYTFAELYALHHPNEVCLQNKSAEEFTITLGNPDRFATITCRGIDGTWTGAVDVSWDGILYVDDLVRDREHSLSPQRMENTYQEYLNKMVDRKSGASPELDYWYSIDDVVDFAGACELMVGTLWNVMDPLERMRQMYEDDPLYRFVRIPALDDNDESNFDYEIGGFTTAYYRDMREKLDDAEWWAKYMQKPYVREGLLMPTDSLRYFNGILPPGDSRVVGVTDVAYGGGDSLSMPIGREYENGDVYIFDWVFNPGPKEITAPIVVGKIIGNEIRATRFEGNQGGDLYCDLIEKELTEQGYKCSCESRKAPNTMAKKEKIVAYSGDVKQKFVFLTPKRPTPEELEKDRELGITRYVRNSDYQKAMDEMCSYVTIGKNEHDDAIDSIVQLDMFVENKGAGANVKPVINPFRSGANY